MSRIRLATLSVSAVSLLLAGCKKDSPTAIVGEPTQLQVSTTSVTTPAAQAVTTPIRVTVRDQNGRGVAGQTVTFTVIQGGGTLSSATAVTGEDGVATAPTWTFGKSAIPQRLRASFGSLPVVEVAGIVQTSYDILVKFYGPPMTATQEALFTNAAARIRAVITADLPPVQMNTTLSQNCSGQTINEVVDDVVIYASIQTMDGRGGVLAAAGPCFIRNTGGQTVVGVMQFDSADLTDLTADGTLQDVITHEMLHVIGVGSLWETKNLLTGAGTSNPQYVGTQARAECIAIGGSIACANGVPVENTGGAGTQDAHWRETTFESELMTGFSEGVPAMPFSRITIGALADLGYTVNSAAFDSYTVFLNAFRAGGSLPKRTGWERPGPDVVRVVDAHGNVTGTRVLR